MVTNHRKIFAKVQELAGRATLRARSLVDGEVLPAEGRREGKMRAGGVLSILSDLTHTGRQLPLSVHE